ncbi:unnamed protein product [Blepharisma stoltei]|uniref:Protein kinase domain-containing protein n=1 Tax=Blepharisma stoltei TaxID=1481888 RepID=A0AAU9JVU7_9CILI|nr:unnamed protein product [Blepharisma stoltei]
METEAPQEEVKLKRIRSLPSPEKPIQANHCLCLTSAEGKTILNPRYEILSTIYDQPASPSRVLLVKDTETDSLVILKQLLKCKILSQAQRVSAVREIEIHQSVSHLNIVTFYDSGETEEAYNMLLEYLPGYTYFTDKIEVNNKPFNLKSDGGVQKLKSFSYDVIQGLEYLHSHGIIHLDLKPGNLLLYTDVDENEYPLVKICDFGLSRRADATGYAIIEKKCGTDKYVPPEVTDGAMISVAADMWSLGLLLHNLAVGYTPHAMKWSPGKPIPFHNRHWRKYEGTGLKEFIEACLRLNPEERIASRDALLHPWLSFNQ